MRHPGKKWGPAEPCWGKSVHDYKFDPFISKHQSWQIESSWRPRPLGGHSNSGCFACNLILHAPPRGAKTA